MDSKTILVSGASGLVGRALCAALRLRGHVVRTLSRSRGDVLWDVDAGTIDPHALGGVDCVVHLAGEPVAQRWSATTKKRILDSRVKSTQMLAERILEQVNPPTFIGSSGINFYGFNRADLVDESAVSGDGFLADVCRQWEGAAQSLVDAEIRTVFIRTGIVLSAEGGALAKMLPAFKLGVGGRIGTGRQLMSWISLSDLVAVYLCAIEDEQLSGPINAVAPQPVSNSIFTKVMGKRLGRPTIFPLPTAIVEILFGEMGKETVLANLGVLPKQLIDSGFEWQNRNLDSALKGCFGR